MNDPAPYGLVFGPKKLVGTVNGQRWVSEAPATSAFWEARKKDKDALYRAGFSCMKNKATGKWVVALWENPKSQEEVEATIKASRAEDADIDVPRPAGLNYMAFQRAGIAFAKERDGTLIADEMGLGKTIQAIGFANLTRPQRIMVGCPASLKGNWAEEIKKWQVLGLQIFVVSPGVKMPMGAEKMPGWWIVSWEVAQKFPQQLKNAKWDLVIIDECHNLNHSKTQRTRFFLGGRKKTDSGYEDIPPIQATRRLALTGTPICNRPEELWPFIHWLDPSGFKNKSRFLKHYCGGAMGEYGYSAKGSTNLDKLQTILRENVMVRRLKSQVLTELPPKQRSVVTLDVADDDWNAREAVSDELHAYERFEQTIEDAEYQKQKAEAEGDDVGYRNAVSKLNAAKGIAFTEMSRVRHRTALAKVPYVIQHLKDLDQEKKYIVFAHHNDVVEQLATAMHNCGVVTMTQKTKVEDRQAIAHQFQDDPSIHFIILTIGVGGVGFTLTASSHVLFAELDWVPGKITQAEDRCVLEGQKILTVEGWKAIEAVEVGDRVIGSDGLPHAVTDKWSRRAKGSHAHNSKHIAKIEMRGWCEPLKVTTDHQVLTPRGWVEAGALRPGDTVCLPRAYAGDDVLFLPFPEECRRPTTFVAPAIESRTGSGCRKPEHEQANGRLVPAPSSVELSSEAMFVFGYYIGDGFASTRPGKGRFVSFAGHKNQKATHLARCAEWADKVGASCSLYDAPHDLGAELRVFSAEWAAWFALQFGRVLEEKRIPEWVFSSSLAQRASFLQGMLASDGYTRPSKGGALRYEYITASERLAADAVRLMAGLGKKPCLTIGSKGQFSIQYTEDMERSYTITSITCRLPSKTERVYDLTVEGAESFVIGAAVVHNCHRIGQHDSVLIQHLVFDNSLDGKMAKTLVSKQEIIDKALDRLTPSADQPQRPLPVVEEQETVTSVVPPEAEEQQKKPAVPIRLTAEQIDAVHRALRIVAAFDGDRARVINGAGFSKMDTRFGCELAERSFLTPRQAEVGAKMVRKYRRQYSMDLYEQIFGERW